MCFKEMKKMSRIYFIGLVCAMAVVIIQTKDIRRVKKQTVDEDRWSWGLFEETTSVTNTESILRIENQNQSTETPPVTIDNNNNNDRIIGTTNSTESDNEEPYECSKRFKPPVPPNYRKPGTRISIAKCFEYIWKLFNRIATSKRLNRCRKYFASRPTNVHGAVGGRVTTPGEFPHMGAIGWKATNGSWVFKCGSTLISEKFVLTAAHCTRASTKDETISDPVPKIVRLGDKNIIDERPFTSTFDTYTDVEISRIIVYPLYKPPKKNYDIALMELQKEVKFSKVLQPACLWSRFSSNIAKQATATGWGVVESGSLDISPELQAVTVDLLDSKFCDKLLANYRSRNWNGIRDHQICAGNLTGGVDSCQGDSGGPLQIKVNKVTKEYADQEGSMYFVVGIISFGVGCGLPNRPGIYTRVSSFVDWIEDVVWENL